METVFAKFVVSGQRVVDVEMRAPYSWLLQLRIEGKRTHVLGKYTCRSPKLSQLDKGSLEV